jgi:DNA ligase-1
MIIRPMLAPIDSPVTNPEFFRFIKFPVLLSPKIDGVRGMPQKGVLYSRTLKRIPSTQAQKLFGRYNGLDGELCEGLPVGQDLFNRTSGLIRSAGKTGNINFHVFDHVTPRTLNEPFFDRFLRAAEIVGQAANPNLFIVTHHFCRNMEELLYAEEEYLLLGYEGLMLRDPSAPYKTHARSTMLEAAIFKLKRFIDDECIITGFVEGNTNNNEQKRDERGYAKRSQKKDGLQKAGIVGTILGSWRGKRIKVAPGTFKKDMLKYMWENQDEFIGAILKFRYFNFGIVNELRFPRAIGLRAEFDFAQEESGDL